ncbi:MAG: hypothetical protein JEZ03_17175 [Bacteroidales bacterium]|nr:hypothetical protein [Bacteroidales bacterium]
MKKQLLILLFLSLFLSCNQSTTKNKTKENTQTEQTVFICDSEASYAYHKNKNCRGLKRCKADVKEIKLSTAKKKGRKPCKICIN